MSIKKYIQIEGTMTLKSGLHIGGESDGIKIGGCDNPIIKDRLTGEPFIPGSSLKGVMRSIDENRTINKNKIRNGQPCGCGETSCMICKMFGAHTNPRPSSGQPRLIVHDMRLDEDFKDQLLKSGDSIFSIVETRTVTMIDRSTGMAAKGTLRNLEFISAGTKFKCKFTLKIQDTDNEADFIKEIKYIIDRIEIEGIGSKTTSGCGEVEFDIDWEDYKEFKN